MGAPTWQELEKAFIKVLHDYNYDISYDRGETWVLLNDEWISVSEFAKHVADEFR